VADIALDAEALRRDRQRYQRLLDQVDQQIAAWNERAEHLRTTIGGLDQLLALAGDGGLVPVAPARRAGRKQADGSGAAPAAPEKAAPPKKAKARAKGGRQAAAIPPPPPATPAAPEPVEPPGGSAADAPRGTDALRLVLEGEPQRAWALPDLLEALGDRGWLPTSRRPEEGVRIGLKRLVERGAVLRDDDGRWRLTPRAAAEPEQATPDAVAEPWPEAEPPLAADAPAAQATPAAEEPPPTPPPPPPRAPRPAARPASFGRPVGGTVTEL
jgi:hypothetical protein